VIAIIGAGIAGVACAQALRAQGVAVELIDRGRAPGGRMASPEVHGRRVDIGAAYFTVSDPFFAAVVARWTDCGLARPWTNTLGVLSPAGHGSTTGPLRYAAPGGLRSLVRAELSGPTTENPPIPVRSDTTITELSQLSADVVVLAMPDPQAAALAPDAAEWVAYDPVITVVAGWDAPDPPDNSAGLARIAAAAFVNDDPDLSLIAHDGARRGDEAPVLVAHTTSERARAHLSEPDTAIQPVLAAVDRHLGPMTRPAWTWAHRWTYAKPAGTHGAAAFGLSTYGGRLLGLCGDSWCPGGAPRIESAWLSGHRLGLELAGQRSG
jgi:renalase